MEVNTLTNILPYGGVSIGQTLDQTASLEHHHLRISALLHKEELALVFCNSTPRCVGWMVALGKQTTLLYKHLLLQFLGGSKSICYVMVGASNALPA